MINNICRTIKLIILVLLFLAAGNVPALAGPNLYSDYCCLMDSQTGQLIYSDNADVIRPVASTTKMMTAILTEEYADLQEIAVISENADHTPEYTIGMNEGQKVTVAELLKVALMRSANDAAVALAEHIAGNERFFAHLMTKKAFLIGAENTHFTNSSGLPDEDHNSTAYDLAVIGRYLLSKEYVRELVGTKTAEFAHPGYGQPLTIQNTNQLLWMFEGADGIKTGTTNAAGKCLVASATRDGRQLIAVALRSPNRNGDCLRLLQWGFTGVNLEKVIDKNCALKEITVAGGTSDCVEVFPERDFYLWQGNGACIEKKVQCLYEVKAPVVRGQKIGLLQIYYNGKLVDNIELISNDDIDKQNSWRSYFKGWLNK